MQVRQEIERDEVVLRLPNKVWQEDGDGCRHSEPQPAALQESASRRQHYRTGDPECEKSRGVARLHAESEHRPDPYPPARIVGLQQPHQKVGNGHSPQVIEGDVLHDRALDQRNRRDPGRHGGQQLNVPPAAQFFRDQPGQHHHSAHRGRGKDTKPYERGAEQNQFQSRDERRDRRRSPNRGGGRRRAFAARRGEIHIGRRSRCAKRAAQPRPAPKYRCQILENPWFV